MYWPAVKVTDFRTDNQVWFGRKFKAFSSLRALSGVPYIKDWLGLKLI